MRATLLAKGFREHNTDHHHYWFFYEGLKTSIKTKVSYGIKEYGDSLLGPVKKQMRLVGGRELDDFFDCDMTGKMYADLLVKRGHVSNTKNSLTKVPPEMS